VLDLSTTEWRELISSYICFIDEFRVVIPVGDANTNSYVLLAFNTLIPQDDPQNLRRFGLPSQYSNEYSIFIHVDPDRWLGTPDGDMPLIPDPTQAILVIGVEKPHQRGVLFVMRMQAFIEYVCSPRTDAWIPWDEWGRGAAIIEIPLWDERPTTHVHGTNVVVLKREFRGNWEHRVRIFHFGRGGYGALLLRDGEDGQVERRTSFEDGRELVLEEIEKDEGKFPHGGIRSLGNGKFHQVFLSEAGHPDPVLHIWELV